MSQRQDNEDRMRRAESWYAGSSNEYGIHWDFADLHTDSQPLAGAQNSARSGYAPRNASNASVCTRSRPASTSLTARVSRQ